MTKIVKIECIAPDGIVYAEHFISVMKEYMRLAIITDEKTIMIADGGNHIYDINPPLPKPRFQIGDKVYKPKGYKFPSTVVSVFMTSAGQRRVVAEMEEYGLLHIFNEDQLELRNGNDIGMGSDLSSQKEIVRE